MISIVECIGSIDKPEDMGVLINVLLWSDAFGTLASDRVSDR